MVQGTGKYTVITGASSGIGYETEKAFAERGKNLEELDKTRDRLEFRFKTGNTAVDTLLNMKYYEIIRMVPDLQMDVEGLQFPGKLFIQSYDIGMIFGNYSWLRNAPNCAFHENMIQE